MTNIDTHVSGDFVTIADERFYLIRNADQMAPFFISVVSDSDHWLFVSSNGGLTAGRVSPETALFPYDTVDEIQQSASNTGVKTILNVQLEGQNYGWEPFNTEHDDRYQTSRHLYKSVLGNKLCFEEINHDLALRFRYTWVTSDKYGFSRQCELHNLGQQDVSVDMVDGLQNILPAGTPRFTQTNSSNLVDAYKWSELDERSGLAMFALYSGITDRAEPSESLKSNTVFSIGLAKPKVLLCAAQLKAFKLGKSVAQEPHKRGIKGAYLVNAEFNLPANTNKEWQIVANVEQTQSQVVALINQLAQPQIIEAGIKQSVQHGNDALARIMAAGDGFQSTDEENVSVHHYANVLFNILRGGVFDRQYQISSEDFSQTISTFNDAVYQRHSAFFSELPGYLPVDELLGLVKQQSDPQLSRLSLEYLPITFGRRHGDPSRPWNQFAINLQDEQGKRLLSYQGNWRDIFQNWEALTFSYPAFIENVIAKFVNASTMDGYNPYRITKQGIDWEVEEPDDPWSYIGYWGDHQIIYLLKMLEQSRQFAPDKLSELLRQSIFSYANVPYRIKSYEDMLVDAKSTVTYDERLADRIEQRVTAMGADGKLVLQANGEVYQVNLLEKLLVPLLCKLGNLVVDGGIWLNAQRPEWNDANNALVGQGLSMVTLYYVRRYICFLQDVLDTEQGEFELSTEVDEWFSQTADVIAEAAPVLAAGAVNSSTRRKILDGLGLAANHYRQTVYKHETFSGKTSRSVDDVKDLLSNALSVLEQSIQSNLGDDGLYHAYNVVALGTDTVEVGHLYPMLEGQVAALSSGAVAPEKAIDVLEALFTSDVYRQDQNSFMLYPDRSLPGFLQKNSIPAEQVEASALLIDMLKAGDERIVSRDIEGVYRFNAELSNVGDLNSCLDEAQHAYPEHFPEARQPLLDAYEHVFNHQAFTGRSGGMFGFEGLGCIYWHMVSKLLLAVKENFFTAVQQQAKPEVIQRLGELYYLIREGIGFNKKPQEYGAFPTDPYSHTPKHSGAQQPGMTGQVKEEILARFGELGVCVDQGQVSFMPALLRKCEFAQQPQEFRYLDVDDNWQQIEIAESGLAFTWCQLPIVYQLSDDQTSSISIVWQDGSEQELDTLTLSKEQSQAIFLRSGRIRQLNLKINSQHLFQNSCKES